MFVFSCKFSLLWGGWSERGQDRQEGGQLEGATNNSGKDDVNVTQVMTAVTYRVLRRCQKQR